MLTGVWGEEDVRVYSWLKPRWRWGGWIERVRTMLPLNIVNSHWTVFFIFGELESLIRKSKPVLWTVNVEAKPHPRRWPTQANHSFNLWYYSRRLTHSSFMPQNVAIHRIFEIDKSICYVRSRNERRLLRTILYSNTSLTWIFNLWVAWMYNSN